MVQFIESLYSGIFPGNITFNISGSKKICIDGKQRITSIIRFTNNQFCISIKGEKYYWDKKKSGYKIFTTDMYSIFLNLKFNIVEYKDLTYDQQIEIFNCIQYGKKVSDAELIKSKFKYAKSSKSFDELSKNIKECFKKFIPKNKENRNEYQKLLLQILYILSLDELNAVTKKIQMNIWQN
jgi:hypothetical protein